MLLEMNLLYYYEHNYCQCILANFRETHTMEDIALAATCHMPHATYITHAVGHASKLCQRRLPSLAIKSCFITVPSQTRDARENPTNCCPHANCFNVIFLFLFLLFLFSFFCSPSICYLFVSSLLVVLFFFVLKIFC